MEPEWSMFRELKRADKDGEKWIMSLLNNFAKILRTIILET